MNSISDERQFLHDIASPVGTALLMLELISRKLTQQTTYGVKTPDAEQIRVVVESLEKVRDLITERRAYLSEKFANE
jgi:hypothetical protein